MTNRLLTLLDREISFNYFRRNTYGRKVNYTIKYSIDPVIRKKSVEKFTIYPEYTDGKLSNIFMSKFIMGNKVKFYKIDENNYTAICTYDGYTTSRAYPSFLDERVEVSKKPSFYSAVIEFIFEELRN